MHTSFRMMVLAGAVAMAATGAAWAASTTGGTTTGGTTTSTQGLVLDAPGQTGVPNGSDGKMSTFGTTSANGTPYITGDGRVGAAAPSAGGKIGGGSDTGGGGSDSGTGR